MYELCKFYRTKYHLINYESIIIVISERSKFRDEFKSRVRVQGKFPWTREICFHVSLLAINMVLVVTLINFCAR